MYEAKKINFFDNGRDDYKQIDHEIDSPMVKSNFEESFEKIGEEKEITGFDVDCDSNDLRLRAPAGSS